MNHVITISALLMGAALGGMNQERVLEIPAVAGKVFQNIALEELLTIHSEAQLGNKGVITGLVVRPEKNKRKMVDSMCLTQNYIEGDKNKDQEQDREFGAVTLMRADVSHALGGIYITGDNIHVADLAIGKKYLDAGDLLVVEGSDRSIKSILLKTFIPHYACSKFQARCGKTAFDLVNSEGSYEKGITYHGRHLHGLDDRLRGVRLVVLQEGEISSGDTVTIVRKPESTELLERNSLTQAAHDWVEKSKPVAEKIEREEKAKMKCRKDVYLKKIAQLNV